MKVLILETGLTEEVTPLWGGRLIEQGLAMIAPEACAPAAEEAKKPAGEPRTEEEPSGYAEAEKPASEAEKNAPRKNGKKR